jgi:Uma2 family endonuclease
MATVTPPATRQKVVMYDADWKTYTCLLHIFAERPAWRLTYDRGVLEIMSPLKEHERGVILLDRFVAVLTEELNMPLQGAGSTTLRRRRKQRGLEPDRCYWIANEPKVRGKTDYKPQRDPPPDLAIETDVTSSSLNRMSIYATLRVPEVWRLEGNILTFSVLPPQGKKYVQTSHSLAFPSITPADLLQFFPLLATHDDNAIVRQFRAWLRQHGSAGNPPAGPVP